VSRRALLALGLLLLVLAVIYPWSPSVGDGRAEVCRSRAAPAAVATSDNPDVWSAEPAQTWWPLGVTCRYAHPADGPTVTTGPGWGPTVVAVAGLLLVAFAVRPVARAKSPMPMRSTVHPRPR
jgi:hypothetical protein